MSPEDICPDVADRPKKPMIIELVHPIESREVDGVKGSRHPRVVARG